LGWNERLHCAALWAGLNAFTPSSPLRLASSAQREPWSSPTLQVEEEEEEEEERMRRRRRTMWHSGGALEQRILCDLGHIVEEIILAHIVEEGLRSRGTRRA